MIHKARYSLGGSFFAEETTRTLERRTVLAALQAAPPGAFCFVLYDVEEAPDLGPDFNVTPKAKNTSGRYYIGGTLYTVEQLEYRMAATGEDFKILASNMRCNRCDQVIECQTGNWQPFEADDSIVDPL